MARDDEPLDLLEGVSPAYLQSLHARFAADPRSVSPEWQSWLEGMERPSPDRAGRDPTGRSMTRTR
jgi:2-oxoglutarate dehydrogenase E1 component